MRLTLHVLGFELFSAELTTADQTEPEAEVQAYGDVRSEATADPGWIPEPTAARHFRPRAEP